MKSPIGFESSKNSAIWPARVPISRIPAFQDETVWVNVLDPLDPVSGELKAYAGYSPNVCPAPINIGYPASWILLLAHLRYLTWTDQNCLADRVAQWLLSGNHGVVSTAIGCFKPRSAEARFRTVVAWTWWVAVFLGLSFTGGASIRLIIEWSGFAGGVKGFWHWILEPATGCYAVLAAILGISLTGIAGVLLRFVLFKKDKDAPPPSAECELIGDPGPPEPKLLISAEK